MRRVIDDTMYETLAPAITNFVFRIAPEEVSEYSYGMYRASSHKIVKKILGEFKNVMLGKSLNTTGIGNNGQYELIYTGDETEEQIFGAIHLTDDMFGSVIVWVSDIDGRNSFQSRKIIGTEPQR